MKLLSAEEKGNYGEVGIHMVFGRGRNFNFAANAQNACQALQIRRLNLTSKNAEMSEEETFGASRSFDARKCKFKIRVGHRAREIFFQDQVRHPWVD